MSSEFNPLRKFAIWQLQCRCSTPLTSYFEKEDSMDDKEKIAREQAKDFLKRKTKLGMSCFDGLILNRRGTKILGSMFIKRGITTDTRTAARLLSNYLNLEQLNRLDPSWLDLPKDKPTARLILDECGVKTYEVDGVPEGVDMWQLPDFELDIVNVTCKVKGQKIFIATPKIAGGEFKVKQVGEVETADKAMEVLGYEVEE